MLVVAIYFIFKSKGFSDESIKPFITSNHNSTPELSYFGTKVRVKFNGSCLKQDKITYTHGKIVKIYNVYEINKNFPISSYLALIGLGPLIWLKIRVLISIYILDMVVDLIDSFQ